MSWTPCICEPAREAAGRSRGMGHVQVACNSCHDQLRQTVFFEPLHDSGHQPLTGWAAGPDLSLDRVGDDGQGDGNRPGPAWRGNADNADDLLGRVRADDACVHVRRCPAGCDREGRRVGGMAVILATRTVTSYLLGGSFMPGTVSVTCDIFSADLVSSIVLLDVWETPPPLLAGQPAPATCRPRTASATSAPGEPLARTRECPRRSGHRRGQIASGAPPGSRLRIAR